MLSKIRKGKKKSCTLQWILTHVNILGSEKAAEISEESRASPLPPNLRILIDADVIASQRLINNNFKYSIPALNSNRTTPSIVTRLRTKHVKGIKISFEGRRSYTNHSSALMFNSLHSMSSVQAKLFKISLEDSDDLIFSNKVVEVSEAVFDSYKAI
ncbi:hypothetical protein TNCV_2823691 [Trichonephila clavipes]|nr:hypothetical protein TNCV_2823691 [Trichonephila clavipes]